MLLRCHVISYRRTTNRCMGSTIDLSSEFLLANNCSKVVLTLGKNNHTIQATFSPTPWNEGTVSQPVVAWKTGRLLQISGDSREHKSYSSSQVIFVISRVHKSFFGVSHYQGQSKAPLYLLFFLKRNTATKTTSESIVCVLMQLWPLSVYFSVICYEF